MSRLILLLPTLVFLSACDGTSKPGFEAPGGLLLADNSREFLDADEGLYFRRPPGWSLQVKSVAAPGAPPDRVMVKYKRLAENKDEAFLRVAVAAALLTVQEALHARLRFAVRQQGRAAGEFDCVAVFIAFHRDRDAALALGQGQRRQCSDARDDAAR